ncbi:putative phage protein (DUF2376) [Erythrobacter dokdonensis DSW-74]|uniref:Putative phage protein (DUF2376) n=1 Tax=Erythrobacter dokdonensis DSW-74 TaxID=1300349 RepID=A0A1A7BFF0_9SPHN|nr:phage tail assembly chaperone [Erythrobacter dokdonensis]OBV09950.1 putative phage protein (DUF2376) [Erythrobacter dokdonensis DSW-74]
MTATFADAARRCCAVSARLLGWRPAEFWSATPGELVMALTDSGDSPFPAAPSQEAIARMMERDSDG